MIAPRGLTSIGSPYSKAPIAGLPRTWSITITKAAADAPMMGRGRRPSRGQLLQSKRGITRREGSSRIRVR